MRSRATIAAAAALVGILCLAPSGPAAAQSEPELVDNQIKGTVGLGLLGAELGILMPGITGLTDTWAWAVFPGIGAAGGVVAGIFVFEQGSASPKAAVATLGVGMGLAIPLTVLGLALGNKRTSSEEYATVREKRRRAALAAGDGLVRFSPKGTFVAAPGVAPVTGRRADGRRDRGTLVSLVSGRF